MARWDRDSGFDWHIQKEKESGYDPEKEQKKADHKRDMDLIDRIRSEIDKLKTLDDSKKESQKRLIDGMKKRANDLWLKWDKAKKPIYVLSAPYPGEYDWHQEGFDPEKENSGAESGDSSPDAGIPYDKLMPPPSEGLHDKPSLAYLTTLKLEREIAGAADEWWESLSKKQQEQYIKLHPRSKYAKQARDPQQEKPAAKKKTPNAGEQKKRVAKPKSEQKPESEKISFRDKLSKIAPATLKKIGAHFMKSGESKPNSKTRRSFGDALKAKSKVLVDHIKSDIKTFGHAGKALHKIVKGKELDDSDKHAIKHALMDSLSMIAWTAIGGGLSLGVAHALPHLAEHFVANMIISGGAKALIIASVVTASEDHDKYMENVVNAFADYIKEGDISGETWNAAFGESEPDDDAGLVKSHISMKELSLFGFNKLKAFTLSFASGKKLKVPVLDQFSIYGFTFVVSNDYAENGVKSVQDFIVSEVSTGALIGGIFHSVSEASREGVRLLKVKGESAVRSAVDKAKRMHGTNIAKVR